MFGKNTVNVTCKRCGMQAHADEFVLDPIYKMLVCPNCVKERRSQSMMKKPEPKPEEVQTSDVKAKIPGKTKPRDWDAEDEFLERANKDKKRATGNIETIDAEKLRYTCPHCNFKFVYNKITKHPRQCPFCCAEIMV
jgi:hypothetical protein